MESRNGSSFHREDHKDRKADSQGRPGGCLRPPFSAVSGGKAAPTLALHPALIGFSAAHGREWRNAKRWPPGVKNRIRLFAVFEVFPVRSFPLSELQIHHLTVSRWQRLNFQSFLIIAAMPYFLRERAYSRLSRACSESGMMRRASLKWRIASSILPRFARALPRLLCAAP
jgi:hypothetical protein